MNELALMDELEGDLLASAETEKVRLNAAIEQIDRLDLSMIKMKLCLPVEREGKGWTLSQADRCERLYKMFLKLNLMYPHVSVVPTKEIDEMWHAHILDTRKYISDCHSVFGFYFHHFPYFGLRGEEDKANLYRAFDITLALFAEHFGENLAGPSQNGGTCGNRDCNGCRDSDRFGVIPAEAGLATDARPLW